MADPAHRNRKPAAPSEPKPEGSRGRAKAYALFRRVTGQDAGDKEFERELAARASSADAGRVIMKLRNKHGLSMEALAKRVGTTAPQINKLEKGQRRLTTDWIERIATALGEPPAVVAGFANTRPAPRDVATVEVVGEVQAGVWRETFEWDPEDRYALPCVLPRELQAGRAFALRVRGDSMNLVFPPESFIVCVRYEDLGRPPNDGDYVVVLRRSREGLVEATVKRLSQAPDGSWWLRPESSDPRHTTALRYDATFEGLGLSETTATYEAGEVSASAEDGEGSEAVEILAKVVASQRLF